MALDGQWDLTELTLSANQLKSEWEKKQYSWKEDSQESIEEPEIFSVIKIKMSNLRNELKIKFVR